MTCEMRCGRVGCVHALSGYRSDGRSLCALADVTWGNNLPEYSRNADRPD